MFDCFLKDLRYHLATARAMRAPAELWRRGRNHYAIFGLLFVVLWVPAAAFALSLCYGLAIYYLGEPVEWPHCVGREGRTLAENNLLGKAAEFVPVWSGK